MTTLSSIRKTMLSGRRLLPAALVATCTAWGAAATLALDGEGDSGSDPTVGTLPMYGGESDWLDQTLTLRGRVEDVRAAVPSAGGDGALDIVDLGNGEAWYLFYGDVEVELDLAALADVEVGIWAGFDGGGMAYSVATPNGFGSAFTLEAGYSVELDPLRFENTGLLEAPLEIHAFHRAGVRTLTEFELDPTGTTLTVRQDV